MSSSKEKTALPFLPQEILLEIFVKLPAKSLVRFRCVSKFLYSLTVDPVFVDLHHRWSLTLPSRESVLISIRGKSCPNGVISLAHYTVNFSGENQGKLRANRVRYLDDKLLGSYCNGVICLSNRGHAICNISTTQLTSLPRIDSCYSQLGFDPTYPLLGFDSFSKRYKVLKLAWDSGGKHKYLVFTPGVDESWREINLSHFYPLQTCYNNTSVHIDGVIYSYYKSTYNSRFTRFEIGAFDVRAENLSTIPFPAIITRYHRIYNYSGDFFRDSALLEVEGGLAIVLVHKIDVLCYRLDVWTWEKSAGRWRRHTIPIPLEGNEEIMNAEFFRLTSNHTWEIVLLSLKRKQLSILVCNFNSQVWRKFDVGGLILEDFPIISLGCVTMYNIEDNVFSLE